MTDTDRDYFRQRAAAELEQAKRATRAEAARAHRELATAYLDRATAAASTDGAANA